MESTLGESALMQRAIRAFCEERLAAEQENKKFQTMPTLIARQRIRSRSIAGDIQAFGQVDLDERFRDRMRAPMVKPPLSAVRKDAPSQVAFRQVIGMAQITKHLHRWRNLPPRGFVERSKPAFGLHDRATYIVLPPLLAYTIRSRLGGRIDKQQPVRHIRTTHSAQVLLTQAQVSRSSPGS